MRTRTGFTGVLVAAWTLVLATASTALVVCPAGVTVQGLDVTWYEGTVDWPQVAASGVAFAFVRFADGLSVDPAFAGNYAGIKAAGMIRGAYQTLRPGQDPFAQADLLLAAIGSLGPGDLAPVLDVEVTDGLTPSQVGQAVEAWSSAIQLATGRLPFIYTGRYFWNSSVNSPASADNPLCVADWGAGCPDTPALWNDWEFWQYTDSGSVPGVSGQVDRDVFNGSLIELQALAGMPLSGVPSGAWFRLSICPNPFNPATIVRFDLPESGPVRLSVFDLAGRVVRTLVDESLPQGTHQAAWDGRDASGRDVGSGTYLARLEFGGKIETVRMGLVR